MDELMRDTTQSSVVPLGLDTLSEFPAEVTRPDYSRERLSHGIVHIGVGNFHRAHQAWYLHRLMQAGEAHDWAIMGAGVRPGDAKMREKLLSQDCLTTLIELGPEGSSAEVIGSMIGFVPVMEDNTALIAQIAAPGTRIVSLTVTEGGYFVHPATGAFDAEHPDMVHDVARPDAPVSAFGAIIAALSVRRREGLGPITIQSCDNLQGNGDVARQTVVSLAQRIDPVLAGWIDDQCSFPNSMVDCIVPATGPDEIAAARALGIDDSVPVTHENFRQWVIEDDFCAGRPAWERAGAIVTDNVHIYEAMKIRILNAGHQVLANAGELLQCATIADCVAHDLIAAFFDKVQRTEIVPYVDPVPGMSPQSYADLIKQRFANPAIKDTTRRVAFDGASRHTGFVLPILRDALAAGGSIEGLSLVEALWARMCAGTREDGSLIAPNDPDWDSLNAAALRAKETPRAWLEQESIYGDLIQNGVFVETFEAWLSLIWAEGVESALGKYLRA